MRCLEEISTYRNIHILCIVIFKKKNNNNDDKQYNQLMDFWLHMFTPAIKDFDYEVLNVHDKQSCTDVCTGVLMVAASAT